MPFKLQSPYTPYGDQPQAIQQLTNIMKGGNMFEMYISFKNIRWIFITGFVILVSCQNNVRKSTESDTNISTVNFFEICKEPESWIGAIQGIDKPENRKKYGFKSCNTDTISFDLIFDLKERFNEAELSERFEKAEQNNYQDFKVFSFEIPMKNKKEFEENDPHGDPNTYPSVVKAYKLVNNNWYFIRKKLINNIKEYASFRIEIIATP